ncbi:MAG TPA: hypothetical protein VN380_12390 [Thermoanaerobaculia bacterium]|jgi:hypothetical protein|nr:hypothetical protein [Thermoanaerobaculia bacterium]
MNAMFAIATVVLIGAALPHSSSPVCAEADQLAGEGLRRLEARAAYEKLSGEPCASTGLTKLDTTWQSARKRFDDAREFEKNNPLKRPEARARYLAILKDEPGFADAANSLALLGKADQMDVFAGAKSLSENGFWTDALASVRTVLAAGHKLPRGQLDNIVRPGIMLRVNHWLEENGVALSKIFLPLIFVLLVRAFFRPSISISDFKDDPVSVKIGKNLAAMTRERLKRFQTTYEPKLGLLNGPRQAFQLPDDISKALPPTLTWLSIIPSLFTFLTPSANITIEGYLHPPSSEKGAGLTLTMTRRGELLHTSTLWQKEFNTKVLPATQDDPSGFYDLAEHAAVWMLFRIREEVKA